MAIQAGERQAAVTIEYGDEREHVAYDLVVVAIGFQSRWFEGLLGEQARGRLADALAGAELERRIEADLLAERLAARAEQRGLSLSDLLVGYAQDGLDRDGAD